MMYYGNDGRSKNCVYHILAVITVVSLISSGLAYDDQHGNEINNRDTNISRSEFDQTDDTLYSEKIGLFVFTQYCGPGERVWKSISRQGKLPAMNTYADLDVCCKQHDECPNYIVGDGDYVRYPGLPRRPQLFSRLNKKNYYPKLRTNSPYLLCVSDWNAPVTLNSLVV